MNDGEAPVRLRRTDCGGLLLLIHSVLAEVGGIYLLTASIVATGIAASAVVAVTCVFLYVHQTPA